MTGRWRTRSCRGKEQFKGGNALESMLDGLLELDLHSAEIHMRGKVSEHSAAVAVARGGPHDRVTLKTEHCVAVGSCNQHQYLDVTGGAADCLLKERWAVKQQARRLRVSLAFSRREIYVVCFGRANIFNTCIG
jgi:hypothetical protein